MSARAGGHDELVVLLDEDGTPVGTLPKAQVHHASTPLHLAFSVYVFDDEGRFLLTRRARSKPTWPGAWTNTCCGHPAPGEDSLDAVRRRVRQELGLELDGLRVVLPQFRYRAVMPDGTAENELCPVHVAVCRDPGALRPDPAEVDATEWVDWARFRADVLGGRREVSPWCRWQLEQLPEQPAQAG